MQYLFEKKLSFKQIIFRKLAKKASYKVSLPRLTPLCVFLSHVRVTFDLFSASEKKRDAPNAGKSNDCVNDSCPERALTAEDPSDKVELEKPDATPVECSDDGE